VPGIGAGIAKKIHETVHRSECRSTMSLIADLPPGLFDMLNIQGVAPRREADI